MSRKRGLSLEEKRQKMMEFFYEKVFPNLSVPNLQSDFFTLKELERLCQKEKVYDCMVDTDKIGTSVYFWAFPSKAAQSRRKKIEELQNDIVPDRQGGDGRKKRSTRLIMRQ
ncbi:Meiotic nuclear division protein 1 [Sparganum proliferum]